MPRPMVQKFNTPETVAEFKKLLVLLLEDALDGFGRAYQTSGDIYVDFCDEIDDEGLPDLYLVVMTSGEHMDYREERRSRPAPSEPEARRKPARPKQVPTASNGRA